MEQAKRPIRIIAAIGLALSCFKFLAHLLAMLCPNLLLHLVNAPSDLLNQTEVLRSPIMLLSPGIALLLNGLIFFILHQQMEKGKGSASTAAIIAVVILVISPLITYACNQFINILYSRLYGAAALAAEATLSAGMNWVTIAAYAATPALVIAAVLNWYREKHLPQ